MALPEEVWRAAVEGELRVVEDWAGADRAARLATRDEQGRPLLMATVHTAEAIVSGVSRRRTAGWPGGEHRG